MVEQKPSKLTTRVRFPSPAPISDLPGAGWKLERPEGSERATTQRKPARLHIVGAPPHGAPCLRLGEVAEWLKAADCKSARASVRWFESSPLHQPNIRGSPTSRILLAAARFSIRFFFSATYSNKPCASGTTCQLVPGFSRKLAI